MGILPARAPYQTQRAALAKPTLPARVIHTNANPLLDIAARIETAESISVVELLVIEVWDTIRRPVHGRRSSRDHQDRGRAGIPGGDRY